MCNSGMSIIPIKQCSMQTGSHSRFDIVAKAVTYQEDLGCRHTECLDGRVENFAVRLAVTRFDAAIQALGVDRKSTRLNSSHLVISYAVFCLKKKKKKMNAITQQVARNSRAPFPR